MAQFCVNGRDLLSHSSCGSDPRCNVPQPSGFPTALGPGSPNKRTTPRFDSYWDSVLYAGRALKVIESKALARGTHLNDVAKATSAIHHRAAFPYSRPNQPIRPQRLKIKLSEPASTAAPEPTIRRTGVTGYIARGRTGGPTTRALAGRPVQIDARVTDPEGVTSERIAGGRTGGPTTRALAQEFMASERTRLVCFARMDVTPIHHHPRGSWTLCIGGRAFRL